MPTSIWILVFFIGWPLSGGNGAASTNDSRPPLPPSRDGCITEESFRNSSSVHGECLSKDTEESHLDQAEYEDVPILEAVWEEGHEESDCVSGVAENIGVGKSQGPGVVQKMVRRFSRRDSKVIPPLVRRNTVARCTDVVSDVQKGEHNPFRRASEQHVIWDDSVSGADAATDHEFSSLMERVSDLYQKDCNINMQSEGSPLARGSSSRKSLPAGALKSYMRGTKASILKTREGSPPHIVDVSSVKGVSSPKGSPAPVRKGRVSSTVTSQGKGSNSDKADVKPKSHGSAGNTVTLRRKKVVTVKPSIPPVLLKGANKTPNQALLKSTDENISSENKETTNKERSVSVSGNSESQSNNFDISQHSHLFSMQCHDKCNSCSLVDLWFTIWHVEFNKK